MRQLPRTPVPAVASPAAPTSSKAPAVRAPLRPPQCWEAHSRRPLDAIAGCWRTDATRVSTGSSMHLVFAARARTHSAHDPGVSPGGWFGKTPVRENFGARPRFRAIGLPATARRPPDLEPWPDVVT